jgi:hypothetical protein
MAYFEVQSRHSYEATKGKLRKTPNRTDGLRADVSFAITRVKNEVGPTHHCEQINEI